MERKEEREHEREERSDDTREAPGRRLVVAFLWPREHQVEHREDRDDAHTDRETLTAFAHARADPEELVERGDRQRDRRKERPLASASDEDEPAVEQGEVGEELDRAVLAGRQERGSGEAAEQSQDGDRRSLAAYREHATCDRDGDHAAEGHRVRDQVIERRRRPEREIEDRAAGTGEPVAEHAVALAQRDLGREDAADAEDHADDDACRLADQTALDRVLEEVDGSDGQRETTERSGAAHTDPLLPIERRLGLGLGSGRTRRLTGRLVRRLRAASLLRLPRVEQRVALVDGLLMRMHDDLRRRCRRFGGGFSHWSDIRVGVAFGVGFGVGFGVTFDVRFRFGLVFRLFHLDAHLRQRACDQRLLDFARPALELKHAGLQLHVVGLEPRELDLQLLAASRSDRPDDQHDQPDQENDGQKAHKEEDKRFVHPASEARLFARAGPNGLTPEFFDYSRWSVRV